MNGECDHHFHNSAYISCIIGFLLLLFHFECVMATFVHNNQFGSKNSNVAIGSKSPKAI